MVSSGAVKFFLVRGILFFFLRSLLAAGCPAPLSFSGKGAAPPLVMSISIVGCFFCSLDCYFFESFDGLLFMEREAAFARACCSAFRSSS